MATDYDLLVSHLGHRLTVFAPLMGQELALSCLDCGCDVKIARTDEYERELNEWARQHMGIPQ